MKEPPSWTFLLYRTESTRSVRCPELAWIYAWSPQPPHLVRCPPHVAEPESPGPLRQAPLGVEEPFVAHVPVFQVARGVGDFVLDDPREARGGELARSGDRNHDRRPPLISPHGRAPSRSTGTRDDDDVLGAPHPEGSERGGEIPSEVLRRVSRVVLEGVPH